MRLTQAKIAFVLSTLAVGLPYWSVPLSKLSLPDAILNCSLLVVFISAAWLPSLGKTPLLVGAVAAGLAPVAAVMLRVVAEVVRDPSKHNLWPFELVIAAGVAAPVALAGAVLGKLLRRWSDSRGA